MVQINTGPQDPGVKKTFILVIIFIKIRLFSSITYLSFFSVLVLNANNKHYCYEIWSYGRIVKIFVPD